MDVRDSGQFNYHLGELVGHFVGKTEEGYRLRQAGERVVEAVLSGTVTETPVMEPTPVDEDCHYCGAPVEVRYRQEQVDVFCPECSGAYDAGHAPAEAEIPPGYGWLGGMPLPPAGLDGRDADEVLRAAFSLGQTEFVTASTGICPRCSARTERTVEACDDHGADGGVCSDCGRRRSVVFGSACTNCNYEAAGGVLMALFAETEFLAFMTNHGLNPMNPDSVTAYLNAISNYETVVRSHSPLEVEIRLTVDGDTFTRTIDEAFLNAGTAES
ncbi:hypothetical protein SY89_01223 [Halolamina pelagica]|uniref:Uncharacterized protein n=1 Tax=Halolamina pelagica TaxID=699431 RepID=A0A0P7GYD1_9EURY|nr:hypothetical protein [Halolamina pelagica]KPN30488.1 hypothetical protein SY89_01223 [Halolamina pelagica]